MASKYRERLLQSSGVSNRKVQSDYAKKLMMKMGWKQGKGLGKKQHGVVQCVQIRRRDQNLGLGIKSSKEDTYDWKDQWWNTAYNDSIKKLQITPKKHKKIIKQESSDQSSSSSDQSSSSSGQTPVLKSKKIKKDPKNSKNSKKNHKK